MYGRYLLVPMLRAKLPLVWRSPSPRKLACKRRVTLYFSSISCCINSNHCLAILPVVTPPVKTEVKSEVKSEVKAEEEAESNAEVKSEDKSGVKVEPADDDDNNNNNNDDDDNNEADDDNNNNDNDDDDNNNNADDDAQKKKKKRKRSKWDEAGDVVAAAVDAAGEKAKAFDPATSSKVTTVLMLLNAVRSLFCLSVFVCQQTDN
jgi:hypothetical protein